MSSPTNNRLFPPSPNPVSAYHDLLGDVFLSLADAKKYVVVGASLHKLLGSTYEREHLIFDIKDDHGHQRGLRVDRSGPPEQHPAASEFSPASKSLIPPASALGNSLKVSIKGLPALDTVKVVDPSAEDLSEHICSLKLPDQPLYLFEAAVILHVFHTSSDIYCLPTTNCFHFCGIILEFLARKGLTEVETHTKDTAGTWRNRLIFDVHNKVHVDLFTKLEKRFDDAVTELINKLKNKEEKEQRLVDMEVEIDRLKNKVKELEQLKVTGRT